MNNLIEYIAKFTKCINYKCAIKKLKVKIFLLTNYKKHRRKSTNERKKIISKIQY